MSQSPRPHFSESGPVSTNMDLSQRPYDELLAMAANPETPVATLVEIAKIPCYVLRGQLAQIKGLPLEVITILADEEVREVQETLLIFQTVPEELLRVMGERDLLIRSIIAGMAKTPASLLQDLAAAEEDEVRAQVATNPSTPAAIIEQLLKDESELVRGSVASNPAVSLETVLSLADHAAPIFRACVEERLSEDRPF